MAVVCNTDIPKKNTSVRVKRIEKAPLIITEPIVISSAARIYPTALYSFRLYLVFGLRNSSGKARIVTTAITVLNSSTLIMGTIIAPKIEASSVTMDKMQNSSLSFGMCPDFRKAATELNDIPVAINAPVAPPWAGVIPKTSQNGVVTKLTPPPAMPLITLATNVMINVAK